MVCCQTPAWKEIKAKFIGAPYRGSDGMAIGGAIGVEDFINDQEAIRAVRMFPDVMRSFAGLASDATDEQIKAKFLPALKVMLPMGHGKWYFHDTLYNIVVEDADRITLTTGDMQLTAPKALGEWGVPKAGSPVK